MREEVSKPEGSAKACMLRFCLSGEHYTFRDVMEVLNFQVLQKPKQLCLLTVRQRHQPSEVPQLKGLQKENSRPRCGGAASSEQLGRGRERKKVSAFATLGRGDYSVLSFRTQATVTVKQVSPWWLDCVNGGCDKSGSTERNQSQPEVAFKDTPPVSAS